jgi:hypothetical protein
MRKPVLCDLNVYSCRSLSPLTAFGPTAILIRYFRQMFLERIIKTPLFSKKSCHGKQQFLPIKWKTAQIKTARNI